MNNKKLNRMALLINLGCLTAGILAYASIATHNAITSTIMASLATLAGSYYCTKLVTRRLHEDSIANINSEFSSGSTAVIILFVVPIILITFEIIALLVIEVEPQTVSWIHIVAAGAAGQNAEAIFRKS